MFSILNILCRIDNKIGGVGKRKKYNLIKKNSSVQNEKTIRCGSEYGGFDVYPLAFTKGNKIIVYSFGIGEDLSFSENILKNFNAEIYAFDPTPKAINYVKKSTLYNKINFNYYEYAIGIDDGEDFFYLPKNDGYVSGSLYQHDSLKMQGIKVKKRKLKSIMNELGHDKIDLLKLDIEGSEFDVIDQIIDEDISFTQLCIEVHDRFYKDGNVKLENMLLKLKNAGYVLISISDNLQEFTFILSHVKEGE